MSTAAAVASGIPTRTPKPSMRIARTIAIQDHSAPCDARTVTIASAVVNGHRDDHGDEHAERLALLGARPPEAQDQREQTRERRGDRDDEARDVGLLDAG